MLNWVLLFFRSLWQVTEKGVLLWLSDRKPSTLICVTDSVDIPHVVLSEKEKGNQRNLYSCERLPVLYLVKQFFQT